RVVLCGHAARGTGVRYCNRYQPPCGASCPATPCGGGDAAGAWSSGTAGTVASGTTGAASGAAGTAFCSTGATGATGTSDITPRSTAVGPAWRATRVACQAMNRVSAKKTIASHLVDLVRKLDAPRAPNTVAEAPPPKPEPAWAPAPRCMRISAIIAMATRTNTMLRMSCSMFQFSSAGRSADRRGHDGQEVRGHQRRSADQASIDVGLREQLGGVGGLHAAAVEDRQGITHLSIPRSHLATDECMHVLRLLRAGGQAR